MLANQQRVASLQLYLSRHGQDVNSLELEGALDCEGDVCSTSLLEEMPPGGPLQRLSMLFLRLQLLPGSGRAGVLRPGAPIKHLEILNCEVVEAPREAALVQALSQLPQLEHLTYADCNGTLPFPGRVLSHLQQLTCLNIMHAGDVWEYVDLVPGLLDLKASVTGDSTSTTGSKLSALQQLTSLVLSPAVFHSGSSIIRDEIDPVGFANKSHLQHLVVGYVRVAGGLAGVSALLSQLQQMTQLTYLSLQSCWDDLDASYGPSGPPAAACAALTASSALQHLNVSGNTMPLGVWQHMLPADRQLPHLRVLTMSGCSTLPVGHFWTHADTARLASCCPNLQKLAMDTIEPMAADVLQPLRSLAALTALEAAELDDAGLAATAELTQLRQLKVYAQTGQATDTGLLQLTQLKQLTELDVYVPGGCTETFYDEVSSGRYLARATAAGGKPHCSRHPAALTAHWLCRLSQCLPHLKGPIWRQVLLHCVMSKQPGVAKLARQAVASLEQSAP